MEDILGSITEKDLIKISKQTNTLIDNGDGKCFGLIFSDDIGNVQIMNAVNDEGETLNLLLLNSHDKKVDFNCSFGNAGIKGFLLLLAFYLDGKTIEKSVKLEKDKENPENGRIKPIGEIIY